MRIIVGLGNPGPRYRGTRHNVGEQLLQLLAEEWSVPMDRQQELYVFGKGSFEGSGVVLVFPTTYMNESGLAVDKVVRSVLRKQSAEAREDLSDLLVLHDEVDLPLGRLKMKFGGGDAGHRGLGSITHHLGSSYARLRMGVGRPPSGEETADHVLRRFRPEEKPVVTEMLDLSRQAVAAWLTDGVAAGQTVIATAQSKK